MRIIYLQYRYFSVNFKRYEKYINDDRFNEGNGDRSREISSLSSDGDSCVAGLLLKIGVRASEKRDLRIESLTLLVFLLLAVVAVPICDLLDSCVARGCCQSGGRRHSPVWLIARVRERRGCRWNVQFRRLQVLARCPVGGWSHAGVVVAGTFLHVSFDVNLIHDFPLASILS